MSLVKRTVAETIGTAFLLAGVVGSGIMAQRLADGNVAIALLANTIATGGVLMCLIAAFGTISGAHFNPAVTLCDAWQRGMPWREVPYYVGGQVIGALAGTAVADAMFGLPIFSQSHHARAGNAQLLGEFVATFGLLCVIWGCVRYKKDLVPFAVASYIVAAYWFTSSTSFANPAVTIGRSLTDTFAGIRPSDAAGFIVAQLLGAFAATALFAWLAPVPSDEAKDVLLPHQTNGVPQHAAE